MNALQWLTPTINIYLYQLPIQGASVAMHKYLYEQPMECVFGVFGYVFWCFGNVICCV